MARTSLSNALDNKTPERLHHPRSSSVQSYEEYQTQNTEDLDENETVTDGYKEDPFKPLDNICEDNENILTIRAVAVGVVCGSLVNASNIYLGLKSGWTASANLFASIVGFALLKSCPEFLKHVPFLARDFGPRENNIVQTAATAAGGMSTVYISTFPAMYQLGLMTSPGEDFWRLVSLTAAGGLFGLFCATPLRKFFIISVARDLHLVFPTPSATAITIRNMHQAVGGGKSSIPRRKMKVLCIAFGFALVHRVMSPYAPGILWDWHPFTWYHAFVPSDATALGLESWGWYVEWTPAFIGTGMLVGTNVATYHFIGALLAWGIAGPLLVSYGFAFGTEMNGTGLASYITISDEFSNAGHPSPRYWLLWPGITCMIAVSLTELACQWRVFWYSGKLMWCNLSHLISLASMLIRGKRELPLENIAKPDAIEDPTSAEDQIKTWMWLPGLLVTIILACMVMKFQYSMPVRETFIALFMAFLFSFLAVQSTGATGKTQAPTFWVDV
ncbi:putative metal-nicotianamine transporter [Lachnellula hyalina]|uniref:Putative metal-nicotianamine transporter n=1 Tax=Lachnellula hyalina TaxID=1316788 RepID=A0A8H8U049_9HELO|nr:putative metal-nicotianamine transporter [Lachnellula hyalina]TVY28884.1 putative metal-nicotianamine transporter [Lachnellula hyalina]